ncbi:MAG: DASS family sodium-coupled anion symporter [Myxococcaceae bacterium]|nr:DASS family sodium-coupled anion symporter [Myxococcaceae bacterium]
MTRTKAVGLVLGPALFLALALLDTPLAHLPGFDRRPAYAAGLALLMAVWWFTEAIPIQWTAMLPLVTFPLTGVFGGGVGAGLARTGAEYANAYIFLFLGGMAVGAALEHWGLHRRIALQLMVRIGASPPRLLLGLLVSTACISLWISNTATAVMMLPIAVAVLSELEGQAKARLPRFGMSLMLAVAYAANVGGMGTKIGTATNSIFVGWLSTKLGYELSFPRFVLVGLPFVVLFVPVLWAALWRFGRHDAPRGDAGAHALRAQLASLGTSSPMERRVAWTFSVAALLWVFGDPLRRALAPALPFELANRHYEAVVAMGAAGVLALARALPLAALRRIPVSALMLLGGSFAMAAGLEGSGLSQWLGTQLEPLASQPPWARLTLASFATVALSAVASNTATVNLMLTLLPPELPLLSMVTLASSCDFALPAGTPPNAIVFGSGRVHLPSMMRVGALLDVAAAALLVAYGLFYLPLVVPP